ncbi:MAG: protoporphyrinogen oxidase [Planctomycetaceae bacterium]|nr:protoporphyrinogen oxidase [Planctomycetaceae bacterium]
MSERPCIAVIGGGLTGLAAVHRLSELSAEQDQLINVTLFEASDRLGGVFGTRHINGHVVETGADSFITNKPWAVDLCDRLGLGDQLIGTNPAYQRSLILHEGKPVVTPEGFELLLPRKLRALLASPLLSHEGKIRVAAEPFVPPKTDQSDESLASFVRRRFGQEMLDRIVQPMVGGIYTADPEHLSMQATLPRFARRERDYGSLLRSVWAERGSDESKADEELDNPSGISGARYGLFASLKEGMSQLLDALTVSAQRSAKVAMNVAVAFIQLMPDGGYDIELSNGEKQSFDAVILALPAHHSGRLVKPWDSTLAERLLQIPYASSAIVVSAHRMEDVEHPVDAFGLVIPHVEGRRILAVSFLSRKFEGRSPEGTIQLRTFVGGAMQPELLDQPDDAIYAMVREELQDILGVRGKPIFEIMARYERAMPQYHVGHLDLVEDIDRLTSLHDCFAIAGNAYRGVGLPDSIHSGEEAAERTIATLFA